MPKPKLPLAERMALKRQKKLEKKALKEEKARQNKRDHLAREVQYGALTHQRNEQNWRRMLMKLTLPRMREELEFAWNNFERVIDCKDFQISLLMDELKDAEEQHMLNYKGHMENMESLMDLFKQRLEDFKDDFYREVKQFQEKCKLDADSILEDGNENLNYLKMMMYHLEVEKKDQERIKCSEYMAKLEETDVRNLYNLQLLRAALENKYNAMIAEIEKFIKDHNSQVKERKQAYMKIKASDDAIQDLIFVQFNNIKQLLERQRMLRQKFSDMKQREGEKLLDLQTERNFFSTCYRNLKLKLARNERDDFNKMAQLTRNSDNAITHMRSLIKKGKGLLTLTQICRKLETEKEKIFSFPVIPMVPSACTQIQGDEEEEEEERNGIKKEMDWFWQRTGQAFQVYYALDEERTRLTRQNHVFIHTHNKYCDKLQFPAIINYKKKIGQCKVDGNLELWGRQEFYVKNKM